MCLPKTLFSWAIALLLATSGMAQDLTPMHAVDRAPATERASQEVPQIPQIRDVVEIPHVRDVAQIPQVRDVMQTSQVRDVAQIPQVRPVPEIKPVDPYLSAMPEAVAPWTAEAAAHSSGVLPRAQGASTTIIDPNCFTGGPYFDVTVDALLWRLEPTRGQPMFLNPVAGTSVRTDDLDLGFQAGPRISMEFLSDEEEAIHSLEIGYFGIYNWFDGITDVAPAGTFLRLPDRLGDVGVTTDFSAADEMQARYNVRLNSVEANVYFGNQRSEFCWAIGPRFIRMEERFNLNSITGARYSYYDVDTGNDLWGVQWVGRWRRTRGCWELTGICKVGIYDNQARQSTLMTDNDRTVVLRNFSDTSTVASFVLDAGITVGYQVTDTWLARVGYSVFVLDNVARATDQLDFSNNATSGDRVFLRQDAVAHGLNFGLEARW